MPRTIVPEEQQRAQNINGLKQLPVSVNRKVQVKSDADGAPNFFFWNPSANEANANGVDLVASDVATGGAWERVKLPFDSATTDDLKEGDFLTDEKVRNDFQAGGDIGYNKNVGSGTAKFKLDVSSLSVSDLFGSKTTDALPEGSSNKYYTDARADSAVIPIFNGGGRTTVTKNASAPTLEIDTSGQAVRDGIFNAVLSGTQTRINVSYNSSAGEVSYEVESDLSQFDLSGLTTDDINEGSNNLYFTSDRVRDEFQAGGDIQYDKNQIEGFDIANASFNNVSFDLSSRDLAIQDIDFNSDGTKMFIVGSSNANIYAYTLSTGFDLSTASFATSFNVGGQDSVPRAVTFSGDGTKMFVSGDINANIYEYTLTTGFDLSTASYNSVSFDVSTQDSSPRGLASNSDGTKFYVSGNQNDNIYEYTLSTGFDLSTASTNNVISFDLSNQSNVINGIKFNGDGTKLFMVGDSVFEYTLSTGFDLSTASTNNVISFDLSNQETGPSGLDFNSTGTKMFIVGNATDSAYSYDTGTAGGGLAEFNLDVSSLTASELFGSKTIDDLPEGSTNLYFTDERAQDAAGAAIVGTSGTTVTYDDGVPEIEISAQSTQTDIANGGTVVTSNVETINFTDAVTAVDNGDGSVTVSEDVRFGNGTFDGDGVQKVFQIAHGLSSAPSSFKVSARTDDASGISHATADGTNITVTYDTAPPNGNGNVAIDYVLTL